MKCLLCGIGPIKICQSGGRGFGKYHPHGDSSIYDALVRMAQEFSMRQNWCKVKETLDLLMATEPPQ